MKSKKELEDQHILSRITGIFKPGELIAIMGTSGAGKTTLLEILAGRSPAQSSSKREEGTVLLKGLRPSREDSTPNSNSKSKGKEGRSGSRYFRTNSCLVKQEDLMLGSATVRETLLYSARLRLPSSISLKEKVCIICIIMSHEIRIIIMIIVFISVYICYRIQFQLKRTIDLANQPSIELNS